MNDGYEPLRTYASQEKHKNLEITINLSCFELVENSLLCKGMKKTEFRKLVDLPFRSSTPHVFYIMLLPLSKYSLQLINPD